MDALTELLAELRQTGDDEATIEIAAEALAQGDHSRERLVGLLDHADPPVRRAATLALGRRPDAAEGRAALEQRLGDSHASVRAAACHALARIGDERSLTALGRRLTDRSAKVRAAAARAHAAFPLPRVIERLDQVLRREEHLPVRWAAVDALAALGQTEELHDAVLSALACHVPREDDLGLRQQATEDLVRLAGRRTHGALVAAFKEVPRSGRATLAEALTEGASLLPRGLARVAGELRHRAPDLEVLARFGSNLSTRARQGDLPRAYGREQELKAIRDRLSRPGAKSLILSGPSGVGKTALIHELARVLAEERVLVPQTILEATTGEVLSGTRYLGEWQTRLKELQDAIKAPVRTLWYVPDVDRLVDAGTSEHSQESFATMLAPALDRGEVIVLGETTPESFRRGIDRYPAIRKLFWKLELEPLSAEASRAILTRVGDELIDEQIDRGVELVVPPATLDLTQDLADDYFPSLVRPGNGVRLLRETVGAAVQAAEDEAPSSDDDPGAIRRVEVTPKAVVHTLSRMTGVPVRLLDDTVQLDLAEVRAFFEERVLGQAEAVDTVVDLISLIKAGLTDPERPLGVLFFAGPTGVGKTEMAKALAEFIFGGGDRLVRVDLGDFREPHSVRRLTGDPHAPDPAARSGLLTAPVRERPFSVVLLDEVEKAHGNVFDLLLPLMDEGRLVDELGRVTDFRRSIIVMTSNLGSDLSEGTDLGFAPDGSDREAQVAKVRRAMQKTFRPEFLNRLTRTVIFAPLSLEVMRRLTRREVRRVLTRKGITRRDVIVETDDSVIGTLLEAGFTEHYGARYLKRRVEELLLQPLARAINQVGPEDGPAIVRLGTSSEGLYSELVRNAPEEEEEEAPVARGATARIKDARRGRLVSLDDLEERILGMTERVEGMSDVLEAQGLRARKSELLQLAQSPDLWEDKARAQDVYSEIAALEKLMDTPGHLEKALQNLDRPLGRARRSPGETVALHQLLTRIEELEHEIEFTTFAIHCPDPTDRGDAFLHLRRVGEGGFPEDPIAKMVHMYRAYVRGKGLGSVVVYERTSSKGTVREAGVRIDGRCAFGLLKGESGLHEWVQRDPDHKRHKRTAYVRLAVIPPARDSLRPHEVALERRAVRDVAGTLLKKHRQHLVLTHHESQMALDGSIGGRAEAEQDATDFLAARVAHARGPKVPEPGVVRRYVLNSNHPTARDLTTGIKLRLDQLLEGGLDPVVLPRILGEEA